MTDKEGSITISYTYDNVGNRTSKSISQSGNVSKLISKADLTVGKTTYKYNKRNQLISEENSTGKTNYTYDANGNLVTVSSDDKTQQYSYNSLNKLSEFKIDETDYQYKYDGEGNRISKKEGDKLTKYVLTYFDDLAYTLLELDDASSVQRYYTYGLDLVSMEQGGNVYTYLQDGHGSVSELTDSNATVVNQYRYDAFGNILNGFEKIPNNYCYNSEYVDKETGFYYLRARHYNPETGTFIEEDTYKGDIHDSVTLHKYLFAGANPVVYEDPTGQFSQLASTIASISARCTKAVMDCQKLHTMIRVLKNAIVIGEIVKIGTKMYDMSRTNDLWEFWACWRDIFVSLFTIIAITTEYAIFITLSSILAYGSDIWDLGKSIINYVETLKIGTPDQKKNAFIEVLYNLGCLVLDIAVDLFSGYMDKCEMKDYIRKSKIGRNAEQEGLIELTQFVIEQGRVTDEAKESLRNWAELIDCSKDISIIFRLGE